MAKRSFGGFFQSTVLGEGQELLVLGLNENGTRSVRLPVTNHYKFLRPMAESPVLNFVSCLYWEVRLIIAQKNAAYRRQQCGESDLTVTGVHSLTSSLMHRCNADEYVAWFALFSAWLRENSALPICETDKDHRLIEGEQEESEGDLSYARLRFFLKVLHDFPAAKDAFCKAISCVLQHSDALSLFAIDGLHSVGRFRRLWRNFCKYVDQTSLSKQHRLADLLRALFFRAEDVSWLVNMPVELTVSLTKLLFIEGEVAHNPWRQLRLDLMEGASVLSAKILSLAFSGQMQNFGQVPKLRKSPYLALVHVLEEFHTLLREGERVPFDAVYAKSLEVKKAISACEEHLHTEYELLGKNQPFANQCQGEWRMVKLLLRRLGFVVQILAPQGGVLPLKLVVEFIAHIVDDVQRECEVY